MKPKLINFTLNSLLLSLFAIQPTQALTQNNNHKAKIANVHFSLKKTDCYTAPSDCIIKVMPSKWNTGERTFDIEKICDYDDAQLIYNHKLSLKDQIIERQFLGNTFCNGIVTISDMGLPFTKFNGFNNNLVDANDGIILINTITNSSKDIFDVLEKLSSLARQAAEGTYSSSQLANMNTQFQAYLNEVNRVAFSTTFNSIPLYQNDNLILNIPIHKNTYYDVIPVHLSNLTTTQAGLSIDTLSIEALANAQAALQPLRAALNKVSRVISMATETLPKVQMAAKHDETITTIDLSGPQFIVHQESSL